MGCCSSSTDGAVFKPRKQRWCTDLLCLLLFVAATGAFGALAALSIQKDPSLLTDLLYTPDSFGNNCGAPNTPFSNVTKAIFPTLDQDVISQATILATGQYWKFRPTVYCAGSCPTGLDLAAPVAYGGASYPGSSQPTAIYYSFQTQDVMGRCFPVDLTTTEQTKQLCSVPSCTNATLNASLGGTLSCFAVETQPLATNVWEVCAEGVSTAVCTAQRAACEMEVQMADSQTFIPADQTSTSRAYTERFAQFTKTAVAAYESVTTGKGLALVLGLGVGAPFGLGFVWALFLRIFAGFTIWLLITLYVAVCIALSIYLAIMAGWFDTTAIASFADTVASTVDSLTNSTSTSTLLSSEGNETMYAILAVLSIIFTVVNIVLILSSFKQIRRLIAIVKECTKIFADMFLVQLFPLGSFVLQVAIFVAWLLILYFVINVWTDQSTGVYALIIVGHTFWALWAVQVVRFTTWTSIGCSIAYWFCYRNAPDASFKGGLCRRTGLPLLFDSLWTVLSKHLGSICFGACVVAIVQLLQILLASLDRMTKSKQDESMLLKMVIKCTHCCLWCLRKTVEFVSAFGFIHVAIDGSNFCVACKSTFGFLIKNPSQVFVERMVQYMLSLLLGLATPTACSLVAWFILNGDAAFKAKYDPIWCAAVIFLLAYLMADALVVVFSATMDTILLCSFKDIAENSPPKYLSDDLRRAFDIREEAQKGDEESPPSASSGGSKVGRGRVAPAAKSSSRG